MGIAKFKGLQLKKEKKIQKRTEEQAAQIEVAKAKFLADIEHILHQNVGDAMIGGMLYERERLYQNYVSQIDKNEVATDNWILGVNELLSFLRIAHVEKLLNTHKEESAGKQEGENE